MMRQQLTSFKPGTTVNTDAPKPQTRGEMNLFFIIALCFDIVKMSKKNSKIVEPKSKPVNNATNFE